MIDALGDGRLALLRPLPAWPRFGNGTARRVEEVLAMAAEPVVSAAWTTCPTCGKPTAA
ncbi:hypothetical protein ACQVP2_02660 [Methylobacterium aquaticum]|uniref:hypothetical protein n=1 Tax=Methylobacterium aquaticum TaxID=270351 RepID=UPI003D16C435